MLTKSKLSAVEVPTDTAGCNAEWCDKASMPLVSKSHCPKDVCEAETVTDAGPEVAAWCKVDML